MENISSPSAVSDITTEMFGSLVEEPGADLAAAAAVIESGGKTFSTDCEPKTPQDRQELRLAVRHELEELLKTYKDTPEVRLALKAMASARLEALKELVDNQQKAVDMLRADMEAFSDMADVREMVNFVSCMGPEWNSVINSIERTFGRDIRNVFAHSVISGGYSGTHERELMTEEALAEIGNSDKAPSIGELLAKAMGLSKN